MSPGPVSDDLPTPDEGPVVVPADRVEALVGATRRPAEHVLRLSDSRWTILHSQACFDLPDPDRLLTCAYTRAAGATDYDGWPRDEPLLVAVVGGALQYRGVAS